ncbi:TPA: hypothetical protein HGS91_20110 [Escherichia coli]|nr:hypothetical protein [Escherichia coli]HAG7513580.1 hypothetical protein [Escherichia coli]HAG7584005.1 hypothetical protein [Escherichia coli]HAG7617721.1 hypothetical protein [Escherichia coli]HAG8503218.1 hypothetical protein [Escherichia coli]
MVSVSRLSAAHHYGVLRPFPPKVSLLAHQISELKNAGVREDRIFTDIMTGATDEREGLQRLLARAEKDDVIICTKMDRLGRNTGKSLEQLIEPLKRYLTGWKSYYGLNQWQTLMRDLNRWIRRRLRSVLWKQWKTGSKRFKELRRRGVSKDLAAQTVGSCHKQWRISCSPALSIALPNRLFVRLGLPEL